MKSKQIMSDTQIIEWVNLNVDSYRVDDNGGRVIEFSVDVGSGGRYLSVEVGESFRQAVERADAHCKELFGERYSPF